jgi:hypothetical protein
MIKICIDKVCITVDDEKDDATHKDAIREVMFHYSKPGYFPLAKYGRIAAKGGRYESARRIHAPNPPGDIHGAWSEEFALLQCNPKDGAGGLLRLEWNPAKWSATASARLFGTVSAVMLNTAEFDQLLQDAKVTRLDVALDVPGIRPDDYLSVRKGIYRSQLNKDGRLETLCLGNWKAAKGGVRIYDKGAEMGLPGLKLTHIERVYKNSKLRLRDIAALPNVFHSLSCHDAHAAFAALGAQGVPPMYRSSVHDACTKRGCKAALAKIESVQLHNTLVKAISSSVPAFSDLDAIWAGWPTAVAHAFCHEPTARRKPSVDGVSVAYSRDRRPGPTPLPVTSRSAGSGAPAPVVGRSDCPTLLPSAQCN